MSAKKALPKFFNIIDEDALDRVKCFTSVSFISSNVMLSFISSNVMLRMSFYFPAKSTC
jgi:hypothetical protein